MFFIRSLTIFQIFKDTILFFSQGTLNLTIVIPVMDIIDNMLATTSDSPYNFSLAICVALTIGNQTMHKYYNKIDFSEVYQIVMGAWLLILISLITHFNSFSPSPSTQAQILQEKQLASNLDWHGPWTRSWGVQQIICVDGHSVSGWCYCSIFR